MNTPKVPKSTFYRKSFYSKRIKNFLKRNFFLKWFNSCHSQGLQPRDDNFGYGRGTPIDRFHIENFLQKNVLFIKGHVLEVGDDTYTKKFGGDKVTRSDILHINPSSPDATIIGNLEKGDQLPSDSFDCLIITQTLHLIYDFKTAIRTIHRILKPGGVALLTFPGLSQMADQEWNESWYWGFTRHSAKRMFAEVFPIASFEVSAFGNVISTTSFLQGIAMEELTEKQLTFRDSSYDLVVCVKAIKPK